MLDARKCTIYEMMGVPQNFMIVIKSMYNLIHKHFLTERPPPHQKKLKNHHPGVITWKRELFAFNSEMNYYMVEYNMVFEYRRRVIIVTTECPTTLNDTIFFIYFAFTNRFKWTL